MRRAEAFNRLRNLAKLKQPADPAEWRIDPQIVGAVIMFSPNSEFFSAGILQPPYFDSQGDAASNYGSAGAGIAHEISHSFDELGNIYDAQGRLGHWWTAEDSAKYHAAAAKLVAQFDGYCPLSDLCVNGKQVLNENIADLAGLLVAHDAYVLSLKGKTDVVIGGLTGEQRFFLAFAQRWRKAQGEAALRRQIATDTHSPGEYRSDTVRNVEAWYKAYEIAPGDKLYLKPEDRVRDMVTPLKIAFVEWPEDLSTRTPQWAELRDSITAARPDILVTNELPFGPWLAEGAVFSEDEAQLSLRAHEKGLEGLIDLALPAVISSRPVWNGKRLANEAFVLENGVVRPLHRKQYFPNEPGWFESEWYAGDGFRLCCGRGARDKSRCALVHGSDVQRTRTGLRKARSVADRHTSRVRSEHRVVENRRCHGVARFWCVRRQFEPHRTLQGRYAVWRRRFRLCAARTAAGGDIRGSSPEDAGTRSKRVCIRAKRLPVLCS